VEAKADAPSYQLGVAISPQLEFVNYKAGSGHGSLILPSALLQGLRLQPTDLVLDLESRFRCRECDARGKAVVLVKWGMTRPNRKGRLGGGRVSIR
jgi:hypothetical protein